jgi:hypothetical protein
MIMGVKQPVEWVAEEIEVFGENLLQFRFLQHKYHMTWRGLEPGQPRWEAGDNSLRRGLTRGLNSALTFRRGTQRFCNSISIHNGYTEHRGYGGMSRRGQGLRSPAVNSTQWTCWKKSAVLIAVPSSDNQFLYEDKKCEIYFSRTTLFANLAT